MSLGLVAYAAIRGYFDQRLMFGASVNRWAIL